MKENTRLNIQAATLSDIEQIAQIQIESHFKGGHGDPLDRLLNDLFVNEYRKRWEKKFLNGMNILMLAQDEICVGFISYTIKEKFAEIHSIYILPDKRGQDLGKYLCMNTLEKIQQHPVTEIGIWLVEGRNQIIRFFLGQGFAVTDKVREDVIVRNVVVIERYYNVGWAELAKPNKSMPRS